MEGARLPCLAVQGQHSAPDVLMYVFINDFISTTVFLSATTWPSVAYGNWFFRLLLSSILVVSNIINHYIIIFTVTASTPELSEEL